MLTSVRRFWSQWKIYQRIRHELFGYTERELSELRIGPGDIDRIAWEGAFGPKAG